MENLFLILLLLSFLAFGLGLVSPVVLSKIFKREFTRKTVLMYFGGATITCFILFGIFSDSPSPAPVIEMQPQMQNVAEEQLQVIKEPKEEKQEPPIAVHPTIPPSVTVAPQQQTQVTPPPPPSQLTQSNCVTGQVDINSAPKEELVKIIHIDNVRADELIRLRPYKSVDGLTKIRGIGPGRLVDIKEQGVACV